MRMNLSESNINVHRQDPKSYNAGDGATMRVAITGKMIVDYSNTYGDHNPIHLDDAAAAKSPFGRRIAHGMLSMNFFSTLLGAGFPGPGSIFLGIESWRFTAPVFVDEEIIFDVRVANAEFKKKGWKLTCEAVARSASRDTQVMTGTLIVLAP